MRTVFYGRVSTDHDDQVNSLYNQINFFSEFIRENNYDKVEYGVLARKNGHIEPLNGGYADEGISGKSLKKREAFKRMVLDAKDKKFDLIVTKSVARFGRSVEDTSKTVKDLKELGVGVYFLDLKVNSMDNSKEFMINLFASLAQEESNNKSFIVQFGIRKAQRDKKFTGVAPYGYDIVKGFLKVNSKEAEIVKSIYKMYFDDGCGSGKIARYLNNKGIPTKKGKLWSQIQVSRILDNSIYKGLQVQHVTQTIDINRDIRIAIPEEDWIIHQIDELIIIDPFLFDSVQVEKQKRLEMFGDAAYQKNKYLDKDGNVKIVTVRKLKRGGSRHSNEHLLSNLVFCANCGYSHKRKKRKAHVRKDGTSKELGYQWSCAQNDMYGKKKCGFTNSITEEALINFVKKSIIDFRDKYQHEKILEKYIEKEFNQDNINEEKDSLSTEIKKLERKVELNFELYTDNDISKAEYLERNNSIQKMLIEKRAELVRLNRVEEEIGFSNLKFENFYAFIQQLDIENLTNTDLKKIIKKVKISSVSTKAFKIPDEILIDKRIVEIEWIFIDKTYDDLIN